MQVGSLCVCLNDTRYNGAVNKKDIYTCLRIVVPNEVYFQNDFMLIVAVDYGIYLDEQILITEIMGVKLQVPFWLKDFRVLNAPTSINIEQIVNFEPNFKIKNKQ